MDIIDNTKKEVPKEKFIHLIKTAIIIDDAITERIINELKIDHYTLKSWSNGDEVPETGRINILSRIAKIMAEELCGKIHREA